MKQTEHSSPRIPSPTPQISSKEFICQVLQDIRPDIKDINFLSIVLQSVENSLEAILCKYISLDKHSKSIKTTITNHFAFCEEDVSQILEAIDANLNLYTSNGTLKEEVCNLFRSDKQPLLQQVISGNLSWSIAKDLPTYIIAYNTRHKSKDSSCIHTFITKHFFKSEEFKVMLGYICECILSPSIPILNLSIILSCKDFESGMSNLDFKRTTLDILSDMIDTDPQLSEKGIKFLAAKLFEKHKYLFCSEYLESGTFTKVAKSLNRSLQGLDTTCEKDVIEKGIENLNEPFTKIEIAVIKKYLAKIELGLIKFAMIESSNTTLDVETENFLDIILTKLRADLLSKTPAEPELKTRPKRRSSRTRRSSTIYPYKEAQSISNSTTSEEPKQEGLNVDRDRVLQPDATASCTSIDLSILNHGSVQTYNGDKKPKQNCMERNSFYLDNSRVPNVALNSFAPVPASNRTALGTVQSQRESIKFHHRNVEEKLVDVNNNSNSLITRYTEKLRSPRPKMASSNISHLSSSSEPSSTIVVPAKLTSILNEETTNSMPEIRSNASIQHSTHTISRPRTIPTHRSRIKSPRRSGEEKREHASRKPADSLFSTDKARILHFSTSLPEISYTGQTHSPVYEKRTFRKRTSSYESTLHPNSTSTTNSTTSESEVVTSSDSTQDIIYKDYSKSLSRTSEEKQQSSPSDTFVNLASSSLPITIVHPISIINLAESSTKEVKEPLTALESKSTYLDIAKTM